MKKVITILAAVLLTAGVFAQAPELMSYQAVIRDNSNNLIANKTVGMQVSILADSANGTAVYVETQTPTTNADGLVSIAIGGGTPVTGTFAGIIWGLGPYFVKIETDPTGGTTYTITGTSQLLSVPYALYARTTAGLGAGTAGQTLRNNGTKWVANSLLYNDGTNIGIGTTTPISALHVVSTSSDTIMIPRGPFHVGIFGDMSNSDGKANNGLEGYGHGGTYWDNGVMGICGTDAKLFNFGVYGYTPASSNGSQNVAVYAHNPTSGTGLDFAGVFRGDVLFEEGKVTIADGTQAAGNVLTSDANGKASWSSVGTSAWSLTGNAGTTPVTNFLGTTDSVDLVFKTHNIENMRIKALGNVGIGTTTPTAGLHVVSTSSDLTSNALSIPDQVGIYGDMSKNTGSENDGVYGYASGTTEENNGVMGMCGSDAAGFNIGVLGYAPASTNSAQNTAIYGLAGTSGTGKDFAGYFAGDVKVNNALTVDGQVTIADGTQGLGKVLTSDADGLASWQPATTITSVAPPGCQEVASVTTTAAAMPTAIATFTKNAAATKVEVVFQTFIYVKDLVGALGVIYELRIDGTAAGNNAGRTAYFIDNNGAITTANYNQVTLCADFTGLAAGSHNVQLYVWTGSGTATSAYYDAGCWGTSNVTIKEMW